MWWQASCLLVRTASSRPCFLRQAAAPGGNQDSCRHSRAAGSGGYAVDAGLEVAFAAQADHLVRHLALMKQQKGGNSPDAVLGRQALVLVDVHLADLDPSIVLRGQFIQHGPDHLAWAAPLRPEIN